MPRTIMVAVELSDENIEAIKREHGGLLLSEEVFQKWVNDLVTDEISFFEDEYYEGEEIE